MSRSKKVWVNQNFGPMKIKECKKFIMSTLPQHEVATNLFQMSLLPQHEVAANLFQMHTLPQHKVAANPFK